MRARPGWGVRWMGCRGRIGHEGLGSWDKLLRVRGESLQAQEAVAGAEL